ncbi:MAG: hypothetical protein KF842_14335 [Caulobacter sp.]|nr:hypothetical protein [Caulobacter sp.]
MIERADPVLPPWLTFQKAAIRSPLSPQACSEALSAEIDGLLAPFGSKPVIGQLGLTGGSLRKRTVYRNSFRTVMSLTFETVGGGSRIIARSSMSPFAVAFLIAWCGMLAVGSLSALAAADAGPVVILIPLLMLAFCVGLVLFGRWMARDEHDFLLAFIRDRVGGEMEAVADHRPGSPIVS